MCTLRETGIPNTRYAYTKLLIAVLYSGFKSKPKHESFTCFRALNTSTFCERYNKGLGWFFEHAVESSHYDFYPFWEKSYKVPMKHPKYSEQLLNSVIMYNALHL